MEKNSKEISNCILASSTMVSRKLGAFKEFQGHIESLLDIFCGNVYLWGVLLADPQSFWEGVCSLLHDGHLSGLILSSQLDSGCSNNGIRGPEQGHHC